MMVIKKPELGCGIGYMVDSKFLPVELRKDLKSILLRADTGQPKTKIDEFLDDCGEASQMMVMDREQIGTGEQQTQLKTIATNARRLLASINAANEKARETFTAHSEYLAFGSSPPIVLPRKVIADVRAHGTEDSLLALAWDYVQALEQAAHYAAEQIVPSKQAKPEQFNGTRLHPLSLTRTGRDSTPCRLRIRPDGLWVLWNDWESTLRWLAGRASCEKS